MNLPPWRRIGGREGLRLLALLPGTAATVLLAAGAPWPLRLGLALGLAVLVEAALQALRSRHPGAPGRHEEILAALAIALLVALLLPIDTPLWGLAAGVCAALLLGRHAHGGTGQSPFQPAALGVAVALALAPPTATPAAVEPLLAVAWAAGGLVLLRLGIVPAAVPVAVLAGALLPGLAAWPGSGGDAMALLQPLADPTLMLLAFFLAGDPASGCHGRAGRWLFGAGVGLLAMQLPAGAGTPAAAVAALLLMNAAAPLLDHALRRRPATPTPPP